MNRNVAYVSCIAFFFLAVSFLGAAEEVKIEKKKLTKEERVAQREKKKAELKKSLAETKCPMSGKPIDAEEFVEYKSSKVYMCCGNCVKGFAEKVKTDETLAAKANHQLVATKQARQVKCALNGKGKINKKTLTKFASTEVGFCCKNCKGKFDEMEDDAKVQTVFGKNFDAAFAVKAVKRKEKKEAAAKKKKDAA